MPIYEYECTSCGKRFEIKQKMTDPAIQTCDQFSCEKAKPVNKVISPPAIMFKGSGWYVTDYSDKFKDGKSTNDGEKTDTKTETKSETKPANKTETKSEQPSSPSNPATSSGSGSSSPSSSTNSGGSGKTTPPSSSATS